VLFMTNNPFHVCATCINFEILRTKERKIIRCKRLGYETNPKYTFNCWEPKPQVKKLMEKRQKESRENTMTLQERVMKDLVQAMKEKNALKKGVLQLIKAGLQSLEKEKGTPLTEAEELQIVQRELKQTKQTLQEAEKANRADLVEQEKEKIAVIESYLPKLLSEDEVMEKLKELGIGSGMNMGEAMKKAMPVLSGKAENAVISKAVKQLIS